MPGKVVPFSRRKGGSTPFVHPINRKLAELGQTQIWLAGEIGCSASTVRNFISGRARMKRTTYYRLLKVLNVDENFIYSVGPNANRHK